MTFLQVLSQLLRKAKQRNLVIPNVKGQGSAQETFEGATVSNYSPFPVPCLLSMYLYKFISISKPKEFSRPENETRKNNLYLLQLY